MRDSNRQKMYRSEQAVRRSLKAGAKDGNAQGDVTFATASEAQHFLGTVRGILSESDPEPDRKITVKTIARGDHSWHKRRGDETFIELREGWGMCGIVLLHEYTHHCMYGPISGQVPDHGGEFCRKLLDNIEVAYTELGLPPAHTKLRDAFVMQRMIFEPAAQREAARKQIIRLRSDTLRHLGTAAGTLPTKEVTYAQEPHDFDGHSYTTEYGLRFDIESTRGTVLHDESRGLDITVPQLRYVDAPMVRGR